MDGLDYDVIIVGAGTAGCYLAKRLAKSGLDVAVLEQSKHTKIDSGIVSKHFFSYILDRSLIKSRIKAMDLLSPSGSTINIRSKRPFAFLLNREKLGKKMRASVRSRIVGERFTGCDVHKGWVDVKTLGPNGSPRELSYSCRVLVGADGAMSTVRGALGIKSPDMTWGLIDNAEGRGPISVYFDKRYSADGFAWQIPQNSEIGVLSSTKPMEYFRAFARDLGKERLRAVGAPIPIGTCRSYAGRAVLVGDAAGQVKPLTGGGIVWGLRCAHIAARAVEYAFDVNRFDAFFWKTEYERKWKAAIGREMERQLAIRKIYGRLNNNQIERIFDIIRPKLERASGFDYDALSGLVKSLPKVSLARMIVPTLLRLS